MCIRDSCGTGDLALALSRTANAKIIGADFAHPMLVRARQKSAAQLRPSAGTGAAPRPGDGTTATTRTAPQPLPFFEADALRLPFADRSFDLVTTAFGFRNLANYEAGLREIQRVLKPGATIAILEFTEPPDGVLGNLYRWYFRAVLPRIGGFISGDSAAYTYLPKSVARFFRPAELAALMTRTGYQSVEFRAWTFGTVALHTGKKA